MLRKRKIQIHYIKCIYIEAKAKEFGKIRAPPRSYSKRLSCSVLHYRQPVHYLVQIKDSQRMFCDCSTASSVNITLKC